jgi:tRNA modification GTPase
MQKKSLYPKDYNPEESITALATPWGESALAVIRLSGGDSLKLLAGIFSRGGELAEAAGNTIHYGRITVPDTGELIDEVMVAVYRAPKSYTGEESAEIFCHGNPAVIKRLIGVLTDSGFRYALPGEFTLRAFMNGKLDLTRAEAVNELIRARTDRARALALNRLSGAIEGKIREIRDGLAGMLAAVEVQLDYPEEEIEYQEIEKDLLHRAEGWGLEIEKLLATYSIGKIVQEGLVVAIAGRTNAGKSTLFNRLLKEERAIVSEFHGTTRDYLEGYISIEGIPFKLIDTAGLREAGDPLEEEGIRRADKIIRNSDLLLYLVDGSEGLAAGDRELISTYHDKKRLIRVWSKSDISAAGTPEGFVALSALNGRGIAELSREMVSRAAGNLSGSTEARVIDSLRQKELLERTFSSLQDFEKGFSGEVFLDLIAVDLKEALDALGEITGEVTSVDILNRMFKDFCVGK